MTFKEYERIKDAFTNALGELRDNLGNYRDLKPERDDLKVLYDVNAEEMREQGIEAAHQGVSLIFFVALSLITPTASVGELRQALTNANLTAIDISGQIRLASSLDIAINETSKIRTTIGDLKNGSQQATGLFKNRDDAYTAYVAAYAAYHGTPTATLTIGVNTAPIDNIVFEYGCFGSDDCSVTYTSPAALMADHFTQCQEELHKTNKFGWYSCETDSCPKPGPHHRLCPGICGKKFAPLKKLIYTTALSGMNTISALVYEYVDDSPHKIVCWKRVYNGFYDVILNFCNLKYDDSIWYTCEHKQCPNSTYHEDDSNDDNDESANVVGTETSTLASEANTETASTSTSTPTAPGLYIYPVGASLATVNGQKMPSLAPGDSHTAKLITKSGGYAIVHWYLLPPGDSRTYGDELFPTTYAQDSTVETEVTFSFTIPSGAVGGVYKLTAYIYPHSSASDQTCYEYSYLIYVS